MGLNTTVLILNDVVGDIEKDQDFGKKIAQAILSGKQNVHVRNGVMVVETHHADYTALLAVGGNCASWLSSVYNNGRHHDKEDRVRLLKSLAADLGYTVSEKE